MINNVTLVGRLTKDPELRYTQTGVAVANFTVAVNRPFSNQQGEREADFINCVIWRNPAESLANYMKKGSLIGLVGSIQTRSYEGQDGKRVYVTEVLASSVQFLESKGNGNGNNGQSTSNPYQNQNQRGQIKGGQVGTNQPPQGNVSVRGNNGNNENPFESGGQVEPIDLSDDNLPF